MITRDFPVRMTALLFMASVVFAIPTVAEYALEVGEKAPPAEISDDLKDRLAGQSCAISEDGEVIFEFWFVKEIALSGKAETAEAALAQMPEISFLGVVAVHSEERYDFRDDPIDPGIYTMRLALQPQDGNHMGTAPFDTFAILVPFAKDASLDGFPDHDSLVDTSSEDTIAEHPPILSIQPMKSAEGEFPRLDEGGDDWRFLSIQFPVNDGDKSKGVPLQFVYDGIGDL